MRAQEVLDAVACLGLGRDRVVMLDEPDTLAPREGDRFDRVVARLVDLVRAEAGCTAVLAPWRHDPHCDHEAASLVAATVAERAGLRHVAYPVWGWTLAEDADVAAVPGPGWRLDVGSFLAEKRAAVQAHRSQYGDLITDDPGGFRLPEGLLAVFDVAYETFLSVGRV